MCDLYAGVAQYTLIQYWPADCVCVCVNTLPLNSFTDSL